MLVRNRLPLTSTQRRRDRRRAEQALGKALKPSQPIHHHSHTQLVICENSDYHWLLHRLEDIRRYGGDPRLERICASCGSPRRFADFPDNAFKCCNYCVVAWNLEHAIEAVNLRLYGTRNGLVDLLLPAAYPAIWADGSTKSIEDVVRDRLEALARP